MLDVSRDHWLGDQIALEALVRFTDEELKHQELFRRIETMIGAGMPAGYTFVPQPNDVASVVLGKSTWSVLALTCLIELFTQAHYRASIEPDIELSPLFKDVFLFHWKEESQHAILDELEWLRENAKLTPQARDEAVDDLIALVGAVDGILQVQSAADTHYFIGLCGRPLTATEIEAVTTTVLAAYRFQYIVSGVQIPRFGELAQRDDLTSASASDWRRTGADHGLTDTPKPRSSTSWQSHLPPDSTLLPCARRSLRPTIASHATPPASFTFIGDRVMRPTTFAMTPTNWRRCRMSAPLASPVLATRCASVRSIQARPFWTTRAALAWTSCWPLVGSDPPAMPLAST